MYIVSYSPGSLRRSLYPPTPLSVSDAIEYSISNHASMHVCLFWCNETSQYENTWSCVCILLQRSQQVQSRMFHRFRFELLLKVSTRARLTKQVIFLGMQLCNHFLPQMQNFLVAYFYQMFYNNTVFLQFIKLRPNLFGPLHFQKFICFSYKFIFFRNIIATWCFFSQFISIRFNIFWWCYSIKVLNIAVFLTILECASSRVYNLNVNL